MAQGSFGAQVSGWVKETKERTTAVYRGSAQRVIEIMQTPRGAGGNLRADTGFLRASLVATTGALPVQTTKPDVAGSFSYSPAQVELVIAGADITDPITAVYTANYARFREYGARGEPGDRWVALAAQQWPRVVEQECAEARNRAGA